MFKIQKALPETAPASLHYEQLVVSCNGQEQRVVITPFEKSILNLIAAHEELSLADICRKLAAVQNEELDFAGKIHVFLVSYLTEELKSEHSRKHATAKKAAHL